jgi:hypothetical protein
MRKARYAGRNMVARLLGRAPLYGCDSSRNMVQRPFFGRCPFIHRFHCSNLFYCSSVPGQRLAVIQRLNALAGEEISRPGEEISGAGEFFSRPGEEFSQIAAGACRGENQR